MDNETIATPNAPQAIGPYSQGKRVGDLIFTAMQVAIDPKTPGKLVPGGIREQPVQSAIPGCKTYHNDPYAVIHQQNS